MPEVVIVDASGQEHVFPSGFNPKRAAAIVRNGGSSALPSKPASAEDFAPPSRGVLGTLKDLAIGAGKGLGSTIADLGELAVNAGAIPGVQPAAFQPERRHPVFRRAEQATEAANPTQQIGKMGEAVAELAIPVGAVAKAVPRMTRASQRFQRVMSAAKEAPVNTEVPGQVALRIQELAERGGTMPRMVRQFLARATDPAQAPMNYEEGRDFYSNISRLSADDYKRLTPVIQREVGNMRTALNQALQQTADSAGHGDDYARAMKEYAQAAKLQSYKDAMVTAFQKGALPGAIAGGAGGASYWLGSKLRGMFD